MARCFSSTNRTTVTNTANAGFLGTPTFTYTFSDPNGHASTANVSVSVQRAPNRAPVANDDAAEAFRNKPIVISVLANDSDPDGDSFTIQVYDAAGTLIQSNGGS
ncbi:MAG: hypothetical protein AUI36_39190 [Cyanobacteria bacterium 13_1_40CM_2_61_4]|nr:MAG: hypothetical protein AUI36_39190 [Cyanobacteria bacterium 13_1_40CM_2_61_4]